MVGNLVRTYIALAMSVSFCFQASLAAAANGPQKQKVLQGAVTQSEIIDNLERLGIKCVIHDGANPTLVVQNVRLGTAAYYKGVAEGDGIRGLVEENDHFNLTIQRNGKVYQVALKLLNGGADDRRLATSIQQTHLETGTQHTNLETGTKMLSSDAQKDAITGGVDESDKKNEKKLAQYNIEVIIDISGSMGDADGTGNQSKFEWCHDQVRTLAQKLAPYNRTLNITTFNPEFDTNENCSPSQLEQIYSTVKPKGGTNLVAPLEARLSAIETKYAGTNQRALIVVITDGMPNIPRDPMLVNDAIIRFTQHMNDPNKVKITFLQIGDTFEGKDFCLRLDDDLVNEGAKYDIVDTETFDELKQIGIINALIDALLDKSSLHLANLRHLSSGRSTVTHNLSKEAEFKVKQLQDERRQLEEQIFGK